MIDPAQEWTEQQARIAELEDRLRLADVDKRRVEVELARARKFYKDRIAELEQTAISERATADAALVRIQTLVTEKADLLAALEAVWEEEYAGVTDDRFDHIEAARLARAAIAAAQGEPLDQTQAGTQEWHDHYAHQGEGT